MKERKGITSRESGMCKGPVAGARRKEPRVVGAQGVHKGGWGPDPTGPCSHIEEFCFILKSTEIIERCEGKTELVLKQCGHDQICSWKDHSAKFPPSAKFTIWVKKQKRTLLREHMTGQMNNLEQRCPPEM